MCSSRATQFKPFQNYFLDCFWVKIDRIALKPGGRRNPSPDLQAS